MKPVRCNTHKPSPYLVAKLPEMIVELGKYGGELRVVDIGGGNGRNTEYLRSYGIPWCTLVDKEGDMGVCHNLTGKRRLPFKKEYADIVLLNYVMMFIPKRHHVRILQDIVRIIKPDGFLMVEMQWLSNPLCHVHTSEDSAVLTSDIHIQLYHMGMRIYHLAAHRFIMQKRQP
jgi:ubiquinone/menaquinone biosynthesis C-methylase UbiE